MKNGASKRCDAVNSWIFALLDVGNMRVVGCKDAICENRQKSLILLIPVSYKVLYFTKLVGSNNHMFTHACNPHSIRLVLPPHTPFCDTPLDERHLWPCSRGMRYVSYDHTEAKVVFQFGILESNRACESKIEHLTPKTRYIIQI